MSRQVVSLDLTTGELVLTPAVIEASEVDAAPTTGGIPRANSAGKIDVGWIPDAVRTINIQTVSGVPALTDIATLVFDNGTVAFLGGGRARITGGGGDTITIQGRPVAANAPDVGQALVWTGSTWAPGTVSGGGDSDWLTAVQLIGLVDGVNAAFDLPAPAITSSLAVYVDADGALTTVPFTMASYENVVLGITPTANGANGGGFYGSSPSSCLVDGSLSPSSYWSSGYTTPVIFWGLPEAKAIARVAVYSSTYGGFGGLNSYRLDYSDDGATWLTAATDIPANGYFTLSPQDPHVWWRVTGLSRNSYEWSIIEVILEVALTVVSSVVLTTPPAIGTIPRASFRIAPTVETGAGGSVSLPDGAAAATALYLYHHFI